MMVVSLSGIPARGLRLRTTSMTAGSSPTAIASISWSDHSYGWSCSRAVARIASSLSARPTLFSQRTSTPDRCDRMAAAPSVDPSRDCALSDAGSSSVRIRATYFIGLPPCGADSIRNPCRIAADTVDCRGRRRIEKLETDEIQPRLARDHTGIVLRVAIGVEHRQVDPGEARMEARAPDDVRDVEHAAVLENWQTILDASDARHTRDPGRSEVLRLRPDERFPAVQHLCADLPA